MSRLFHDARSQINPSRRERIEATQDSILDMTHAELESYLDDNLTSQNDTKEFLKRLTKIVAGLARD